MLLSILKYLLIFTTFLKLSSIFRFRCNCFRLLYSHNEVRNYKTWSKNNNSYSYFLGRGQSWHKYERARDRRTSGNKVIRSYWPITYFLDHSALLSSRPHIVFRLLLGRGVLNWKPAVGPYSKFGAQTIVTDPLTNHSLLAASWDWLKTETQLLVSHVDILIYHFIKPTCVWPTTWLLPPIFTSAFCAENLWLISRSRINIQHYILLSFKSITRSPGRAKSRDSFIPLISGWMSHMASVFVVQKPI